MYFINKSSPSKSVSLLNKNKESLVNSKTKKIKLEKEGKKAGRPSFFRLFLVGGALSVSVALSLRFAKPAHAASSTPPVNKVVTSSKLTSFSGTGGLGLDKSFKSCSRIPLNKEMHLKENRSLKTIKRADETSQFPSSQSLVFGTPFPFVKNFQISQRSMSKSGEAQSSFTEPISFEIVEANRDFNQLNLNQKLLDYNMHNSTSQITDPGIQDIILDSARKLADCKLSSLNEVSHILRAMYRLRIDEFDRLGSNCDKDKLELFRQKTYGLKFLLTEDLKKTDSYRNRVTHNVKEITRKLVGKVEEPFFSEEDVYRLRYNDYNDSNDYNNWSLSYKTSFNRAVQKLKLREAQALESFSDDFINDQSCDLPLKVYTEFPKYFRQKYFKLFDLYNHYWKFKNYSHSMRYRCLLCKKEERENSSLSRPPYSLIEAAEIDAFHCMKRDNLIHWYNNKNKTNYKLDYRKKTGREPKLFGSWLDEMNLGPLEGMNLEPLQELASKKISSKISNDDNEGYLCPPTFRGNAQAPKDEEDK
nr:hypothetical protein [Klebsormidium nitens]